MVRDHLWCLRSAVSNTELQVVNEKGLDVTALRAHAATGRPLSEFTGGSSIPKDSILTVPCDVLVPAAIGASRRWLRISSICSMGPRQQTCGDSALQCAGTL